MEGPAAEAATLHDGWALNFINILISGDILKSDKVSDDIFKSHKVSDDILKSVRIVNDILKSCREERVYHLSP